MEEETIIITALSTLTPLQLSHLTHTITTTIHRHRHRLFSLLSSTTLFSATLHHLHSLSLPQKSLLLSRYLLSTLHHLTLFSTTNTPPPTAATTTTLRLQDYDAVLLLLLLCELHQHDPSALEAPKEEWRVILSGLFLNTMLSISGIGVQNGAVLIEYIEVVARCLRFVGAIGGGGGGKVGKEVAASPAVVVALPSVEVSGGVGGLECVICKEEMKEGRDVCELPCQHLFHWICILPWLSKRNTCPCCRFRLPSDDVIGEIQRLWGVLVKMSGCRRSDGDGLVYT